MKLAVVILNWNGLADTGRTVETLATWIRLCPHLIVVDNASTERDGLRDLESLATVLYNDSNLGFAGGTNRGVEEALSAGADAVLLLNNDAHIDESNCERLVWTLDAQSEIGLVAPLLYDQTGSFVSAGGHNPVFHLQTRNRAISAHKPIFAVEQISGTVALVARDVWIEIGLLDERYFFSTEMADLCRRARNGGFSPSIESRAHAVHNLERSASSRESLYTYYIIRNRFLYIHNFYGRARLALRVLWGLYGLLLWLRLRVSGQRKTATAVRLGTLDGLSARFGNQNERILRACR